MLLGGGPHLALRPWQQLPEVLPVREGLQHGQEVLVADGHPEPLRLGRGPPGEPVLHVLGHDVVPAGTPAKDSPTRDLSYPRPPS